MFSCLLDKDCFRILSDYGCKFVSIVLVDFIIVVFIIAHCRNMHNTAPHGVTAAEAFISSSAVVQEGYPED